MCALRLPCDRSRLQGERPSLPDGGAPPPLRARHRTAVARRVGRRDDAEPPLCQDAQGRVPLDAPQYAVRACGPQAYHTRSAACTHADESLPLPHTTSASCSPVCAHRARKEPQAVFDDIDRQEQRIRAAGHPLNRTRVVPDTWFVVWPMSDREHARWGSPNELGPCEATRPEGRCPPPCPPRHTHTHANTQRDTHTHTHAHTHRQTHT